MRGREVFYPMGWDDNGLPTERRVQNYFGVRCDPALPYDPDFTPPAKPGKEQVPVSRRNFIELCERLTDEDEKAFEDVRRKLGLSVDWSLTYQTIDERARVISQQAFLRNLARGEAYMAEAPTLWDVTFRTAAAQAELEDRVIGWDGRFRAEPPQGLTSDAARAAYAELAGATPFTARERLVAMLRERGEMLGDPRPITHPVKFFQKGDKPLEIVTTRQWYIRNGGRDEKLRARLLERGAELNWVPPHMRVR
jgi:valyl-tRNA synthetase